MFSQIGSPNHISFLRLVDLIEIRGVPLINSACPLILVSDSFLLFEELFSYCNSDDTLTCQKVLRKSFSDPFSMFLNCPMNSVDLNLQNI